MSLIRVPLSAFTTVINGGGMMYVATNAVNGGYLLEKPSTTVTTF